MPYHLILYNKTFRGGSALVCSLVPENRSVINSVKNIASQIDITGLSDYLTAIIYEHELVRLLLRRHKGALKIIIMMNYYQSVLRKSLLLKMIK